MALSKSQILRGLQCEKSLWLYNHRREVQSPVTEARQAIFDEGHLVGKLAQELYPGGQVIGGDKLDLPRSLNETREAIQNGQLVLFEAAAQHKGCLVLADILVRTKLGANTWDLIEVKSSTQVKDTYPIDLTVQNYILNNAGIQIRNCFLMHVDNTYVRNGALDRNRFFKKVDMTALVKKNSSGVDKIIRDFQALLANGSEPDIDVGPQCTNPYDCDFMDYCWDKLPEESIYNAKLSWKKKALLKSKGILTTDQIPSDFKLTPLEDIRLEVARSGQPRINPKAIQKLLSQLQYPLYFFDFETVNPAIPPYSGLRPYQHLPFQFSLRIHDGQKELEHVEFLGTADCDPQPELTDLLVKKIGSTGSIVVYNANFEIGRLKDLSEAFPNLQVPLQSAMNRIWDLRDPFSKRAYMHPQFNGSNSIKAVLPVLIPSMSYENLEIAEGTHASRTYLDMMSGKLSKDDCEKARQDLLVYCGQDTQAMVEILRVLKEL